MSHPTTVAQDYTTPFRVPLAMLRNLFEGEAGEVVPRVIDFFWGGQSSFVRPEVPQGVSDIDALTQLARQDCCRGGDTTRSSGPGYYLQNVLVVLDGTGLPLVDGVVDRFLEGVPGDLTFGKHVHSLGQYGWNGRRPPPSIPNWKISVGRDLFYAMYEFRPSLEDTFGFLQMIDWAMGHENNELVRSMATPLQYVLKETQVSLGRVWLQDRVMDRKVVDNATLTRAALLAVGIEGVSEQGLKQSLSGLRELLGGAATATGSVREIFGGGTFVDRTTGLVTSVLGGKTFLGPKDREYPQRIAEVLAEIARVDRVVQERVARFERR